MTCSDISNRARRKFLGQAGAAAITVAAPLVVVSRSARAAGNLVLVSWGGNYRSAVEQALTKPFTKKTGINVTIVDTPDMAKVKAQVMTGNVQWDVFDAVGPMAMAGIKNGYWEKLDLSRVSVSDLISRSFDYAVPFYAWTGGMCWDEKKFPDGKHPDTFAEYWDVKKFPGQRTLRNRASETMEIALLADGVAPDKMYPLDVDRAFRSLDRIKPYIAKWVDQTPQTVSLVQSGQVDFSYTYATRVKAAQESGLPIGFSFKQNIVGLEYLTVLKGAPNKAAAMEFVAFTMTPDRQAALMNLMGNTPANKQAMGLMAPAVKKWLSNPDSKANVICDDAWWADHYDDLNRRFKEWVLS